MPCKDILQFWSNCDYPSIPNLEIDGCSDPMVSRSNEQQLPALESLDDSISSSCSSSSFLTDFESATHRPSDATTKTKRVSFTKVEIREYAVVVGDHPLCEDGLPISLDWKHTEETKVIDLTKVHDWKAQQVRRFSPLRRLSYEDRVQRLTSVSGMTTEEVIDEEVDLVCRSMQEMWYEFAKELTFSFEAIEDHFRKVCLTAASKRHCITSPSSG